MVDIVLDQALGQAGMLLDQSFREPKLVWVQGAEEHAKAARLDSLLELGELLRLRNDQQVSTLGVLGRGPEWAATEQPHRPGGPYRLVVPNELSDLFHPRSHLRRAADHKRVIVGHVTGGLHRSYVRFLSGRGQLLGNAVGDPLRGAALAGIRDEYQNGLSPADS